MIKVLVTATNGEGIEHQVLKCLEMRSAYTMIPFEGSPQKVGNKKYIESYLRSILPLSRHLFKYFKIEAWK